VIRAALADEYLTIDAPRRAAEELNAYGAMGVTHLAVRFRSRDVQEQLDQIAAFGAEVAPLLHR